MQVRIRAPAAGDGRTAKHVDQTDCGVCEGDVRYADVADAAEGWVRGETEVETQH